MDDSIELITQYHQVMMKATEMTKLY